MNGMWAVLLVAIPVAAEVVSVQMRGGPETSRPEMNMAKFFASEILAAAGVELEWCGGPSTCRHWAERIVVTLKPEAPANLPALAMAEASVFEGRQIRLYLDRIRVGSRPAKLLAYVMAHEITHLLQGCDRHSPSGVMKARWDHDDYARMGRQRLALAAEDVELIQLGLSARPRLLASR